MATIFSKVLAALTKGGEAGNRQLARLIDSVTNGGESVSATRTLTVGPTTQDLSADRTFIPNVTNDAQTKEAVVPNTAPTDGQILVGDSFAGAYYPRDISGADVTASMDNSGKLSITAIPNASLANPSITIGGVSTALGGSVLGNVTNDAQTKAAIVPNTAPTDGQLLVGRSSVSDYVPRDITGNGATISLSLGGVISISNIANGSLANSSITIAGNSTSLGGTVTQDQITGLISNGIVKRTAANTLSAVTAPSGAIVGTTDSQSLSNKRILKRVSSASDASSLSPDLASFDVYRLTALTQNLTINNPTNSSDGDELLIQIRNSSSTSHNLTWGGAFVGTGNGTALLTSTGADQNQYAFLFRYVGSISLWQLMSVQ